MYLVFVVVVMVLKLSIPIAGDYVPCDPSLAALEILALKL